MQAYVYYVVLLWGSICTMGNYLYYGKLFVLWGTICTIGNYLYFGELFVLWGTICTMRNANFKFLSTCSKNRTGYSYTLQVDP